jgi:hypothetical protein
MANGGLQVPTTLWSTTPETPGGPTRAGTYAEAFDHCLYQDYDAAQGRQPAWDTAEVAARNEKGALQYLSPALRAAFKFVMYTWYEPDTYLAADQAAVVDDIYKAYGQGTPGPNTGITHTDAPLYIQAMNDYIAAHNGTL